MEIGSRLKEAREAKNISLDSLQETTKIQKRYLVAIEQGNLHILPGKFYARAFIKEYATAVGLNPDELLAGHKDESPETEVEQTARYTRMQRSKQANGASSKGPAILTVIPTIIVILLVIGIFIVAWTLYQKAADGDPDPVDPQNNDEIIRNKDDHKKKSAIDDNDSEGSDEDKKTEPKSEPEEEPEEDVKLVLIEAGSGSVPESTFELSNTSTSDKVIIKFEPTGASWLDVKNEQNGSLLGVTTVADSPIELDITGEERVRINIGNTSQIPVIKINDIELEYPADINKFITQRIWINIKPTSE